MTSKFLQILFFLSSITGQVAAQLTPSPPSDLLATAESDVSIQLNWQDNSSNEDLFIIERGDGDSDDFEQIATVSANVTTYTDEELSPKSTYQYRVKARNNSFFTFYDSDYSDISEATTFGPPSKPTNFIISTASQTSIDLQWQVGSFDTQFFEIERSQSGSNDNDFDLIATIESSSVLNVFYTDEGLNSNTQYRYRVKATNEWGESDYTNNATTTTFQFQPTLGDILDPAPIYENSDPVVITISGISAGGNENQKLTVKAESDDKGLMGNPAVNYSSPNSSGTLTLAPKSNKFGTVEVTVTVTDDGPNDPPDNINSISKSFTVTILEGLSDLTIQNLTVPELVCGNESFALQGEVINYGRVTPETSMKIYFSAGNSILDQNDQLLSTVTVPSLVKDGVYDFDINASISNIPVSGPYFFIFIVDPDNMITESLESNNLVHAEFRTCLPDLNMTNVNLPAAQMSEGQTFEINFNANNLGSLDAGSHKVRYFFTDDEKSIPDESEIKVTNIASIDAGESTLINEQLSIPDGTADGNYFLILWIDADDEIKESNEENNIISRSIKILNLPDLYILSMDIEPVIVAFGQTLDVTTEVSNKGKAPAAASLLKYYISSDTIVSADDHVFSESSEINSLNVGQSMEVFVVLPIPEEFEEGDYYILGQADANKTVSEMDETNNSRYDAVSILSELPPVIVSMEFPSYRPEGSSNTVIKLTAKDDMSIDRVLFYFRGIRSPIWDSTLVNGINDSTFIVSIPGAIFDEAGLEFNFDVFDDVGLRTKSSKGYIYREYPNNGLSIPMQSFGEQLNNYHMISIPLDLEYKQISSCLEDELGPYDPSRWRIFHFENDEMIEYGQDFNEFEIGEGYWFIVKDQITLNTGAGKIVQANQFQKFEISLQPGWNQIGNPYNFDVKWSDVLSENGFPAGISGDIKVFEAGYKSVDILKKFQGGFVYSEEAILLRIPLKNNDLVPNNRQSKVAGPPSQGWRVNLSIGNQQLTHQINGFGMHPAASNGLDPYDEAFVPYFDNFSGFKISFENEISSNKKVAKDVVAITENYTWNLSVESKENQLLYLSWNHTNYMFPEKNLILFNPSNGLKLDMQANSGIWIDSKSTKNLKIIYGDPDFISKNAHVYSILSGGGYPNPFDHKVVIPYALPESQSEYQVNINIFNSLGQHVKTLLNDTKQAGVYEIEWLGENMQGEKVNPGVYIYRLEVENNTGKQIISKRIIHQ